MTKRVFLITSILFLLLACNKDEDDTNEFPEIDRGEVEVNSYQLILEDYDTNQKDTFGYGAMSNGDKGYDTIRWNVSPNAIKKYFAQIQFFNDGVNVTDYIEENGTSYIVCFRDYSVKDLKINDKSLDSEFNELGLETEWAVENNITTDGLGFIKVTLNYQSLAKNNLCDSGVRLFEAKVPYKLLK